MNNPFFFQILLLCCVFLQAKAQTPQDQPNASSQNDSNFEPSLAIVMGILFSIFLLTCILLIYAKCSMGASVHNDPEDHPVLTRSRSRFSGIEKTVIESLPFFRFSSLKGSKEGLECAVCISKFEDCEILRLLPHCKHAFHMNCIDHWLEQHSSCPLCRQRISPEDVEVCAYSSSMRLIDYLDRPEEESNIEIFVQREEEEEEQENGNRRLSSRFTIGSSFRRLFKTRDDEKSGNNKEVGGDSKMLHKFNHKIFVSDFVLKHRWSNVSSSDLMYLNSEMLDPASSNGFPHMESNHPEQSITEKKVNDLAHEHVRNIKEEMDKKFFIENKFITLYKDHYSMPFPSNPRTVDPESGCSDCYETEFAVSNGRRSMSDIAGVARFGGLNMKSGCEQSCLDGVSNNTKEERLRKVWLSIVRRTVQWFANRERKSHASQGTSKLPNV